MDISMPELDGVQATKEIVKHLPGTEVLVLSMHADDNYVRNALDAGAKGYLLKSAIDVDLVGAIRAVAEGKRFMGSGLKYVAQEQDDQLSKLTGREKQVLQLIAQGKSNKEIAGLLELSVNTVSVHRANLMEKMNIHRTAELVLFAIRKGFIEFSSRSWHRGRPFSGPVSRGPWRLSSGTGPHAPRYPLTSAVR
jgi:DNA-binding NarL/FixJ family response regulator